MQIEPVAKLRVRLTINGLIQGVGFRPFAYRLAHALGLSGWVQNTGQAVVVEIQGSAGQIQLFQSRLKDQHPPAATLRAVSVDQCPREEESEFVIRQSLADMPLVPILPDIATCPDCIRELFDPADRRFGYPFINCTQCGPRYSIVERLPYDRINTTMRRFEMCAPCRNEYDDPNDRRFHAQPNACPDCGPHLQFLTADGNVAAARDEALRTAILSINDGAIIAVMGLGGFNLICDARSDAAVTLLRQRKQRAAKPFALMLRDIEMVRRYCEADPAETELLVSPQAPVVLLRRLADAPPLSGAIAPGCPELGIMLPSTPLHHLLMQQIAGPVIATSGNRSNEPLCANQHEAVDRLTAIADGFLVHDRPIAAAIDDSVARIVNGQTMLLRRARGYAPYCFPSPANHAPALAVGGHLKNTVAFAFNNQILLSPHIGNLDSEKSTEHFAGTVEHLRGVYALEPALIVHDKHPDYASTQWAQRQQAQRHAVQHHVAHIYATVGEHGLAPPLLGVAWDGVGYGDDSTVWGGEWFRVEADGCRRVAHLRPFLLPGNEQAIREPGRAALGVLYDCFGHEAFDRPDFPELTRGPEDRSVLRQMLEKRVQTVATSSMGRLFDAVAALTGVCLVNRFEGQAAMQLEWIVEDLADAIPYPFDLSHNAASGLLEVDWRPMIPALLDDRQRLPVARISARFHATLIEVIFAVARRLAADRLALGGGCFQNATMLKAILDRATREQMAVHWPRQVPANDGGLAFGQLVASEHWQRQQGL